MRLLQRSACSAPPELRCAALQQTGMQRQRVQQGRDSAGLGFLLPRPARQEGCTFGSALGDADKEMKALGDMFCSR